MDDINHLYLIADLLITDYSSVFFDYGILKKPIRFYMYDLEDYKDSIRGFYFGIDSFREESLQKRRNCRMRSVTVSTTSFTTKNTGNSMRPSATGKTVRQAGGLWTGYSGARKDKKTNETILERHKALHALCEICHKIGIEVRSGQLTFELAMVDFRSYFYLCWCTGLSLW